MRRGHLIAVALLAVHAGLLAFSAARQSPTVDEPVHLAAGVRIWRDGRFDLDRGNPTLLKVVAGLPVALAGARTDWSRMPSSFPVANDFLDANGPRSFWLTTLGRWACIPFSLVGGWICFRWASELYGRAASLMALTLWCFCPFVIANGELTTGDMAATSFGVAAFYFFWRWLRRSTWRRAVAAGLVLGLAELSKFLWVILYPLFPALWLIWRFVLDRKRREASLLREGSQCVVILLLAVYVTNGGYLFDGAGSSLRTYQVYSRVLDRLGMTAETSENRHWLGDVPVPVPADYMRGISEISTVFQTEYPTYLNGRWQRGGWSYYYFYGLFLKVSLGTWGLIVLAIGATVFRRESFQLLKDELILLVGSLAVLDFVTLVTTVQYTRYVLPALPFLLIWGSRSAQFLSRRVSVSSVTVAGCLGWSILSCLWVYPHCGSYFNLAGGGPLNGHRHMIESSIDWGQDLLYLRKWLDDHPESRPLHLAYFGRIDPRLAGIQFSLPSSLTNASRGKEDIVPEPGWYAISVSLLHGFPWYIHDGEGERLFVGQPRGEFDAFLQLRPVGRAGYSIYIYHVTDSDRTNLLGRDRSHGQ